MDFQKILRIIKVGKIPVAVGKRNPTEGFKWRPQQKAVEEVLKLFYSFTNKEAECT